MMKRIFVFMSVAAVCLSFASCNKETESTPVVPVVTETPVFTAGTDEVGNVKSQLGSDLNIYWKPADTLKMFYGDKGEYLKCYSKIKDTCKSATFYTKDTPPEGPAAYCGLYPFTDGASFDVNSETISTVLPKGQSGVAGTFDDGLFLTVTMGDTGVTILSFKNVCSCFKFSLSSELDDVAEVTLSGNNGEGIAGNVVIGFDEDLNPTHSGADATSISLTPKEGNYFATEKEYYIVCLPTTFSKGISLKITSKSRGEGTRQTSNAYILSRNKVSNLAEINARDIHFSDNYLDNYTATEGKGLPFSLTPDIEWAPFNVGASEEHQHAWAGGVKVSGKKGTLPETDYVGLFWCDNSKEGTSYACPYGWRLPTQDELSDLSKANSEWTSYDGVDGREFADEDGNFIFLPATGCVGYTDYYCFNTAGGYLSSTIASGSNYYFLDFSNESIEMKSGNGWARSVRCVRDLK